MVAAVACPRMLRRLRDRRYGLPRPAAEKIELERVGLGHPNRERYEASPWRVLSRVLPVREVGPDDVLLDFGAGMGRLVLDAALRYPFRRIEGVELSPEFAAAAREAIARNRDRLRCPDVEIVVADALEYRVPDDVTVAYFHNPFQEEIFAAALGAVLESLDRQPRRMRIAYLNPVEHEMLIATGRIREVRRARRRLRRWQHTDYLRLYEAV